MGAAHARFDPPPRYRRRLVDCRPGPADVVAVGAGRRRLFGLCQGSFLAAWPNRSRRADLELLPTLAVRHPPSDHGHGRSVRARGQQDLRCPDHRRIVDPDRRHLVLSPRRPLMSLGQSASPLGKVRGLGSAGEGGEHWLTERVTSIALLLLGTWLIASLLILPDLHQ